MAADDEALRRGRAALAAAGLADDETAPARLAPLAGTSADVDLAIVERLARELDVARAAALRAVEQEADRHGWKRVVKEARRQLYRFAQHGVDVPAAAPAAPPPPRRTIAPLVEAWLSPIDGRGDRLVWIARPQREGGLAVLTAVLNEPAGLRDVALAELSRKTLRRMERDLRARHGLRMVAADAAYCDALLAEGFARARAAGTSGFGVYPTLRMRLFQTDPAPRDAPLAERVIALPEDATALVARGAALLDVPEFTTWRLERPAVAAYLDEIAAVRDSPIVLSRPQQEERVRAVIARALRELFSGAAGTAERRRVEEMAYYLFATDRRELADVALATARALGASTTGGEGIPFFEELTRRSFAALLEEDAARARAQAEASVLVRPGTPAAAIPRPGAPRGPIRR